MRSTKKSLENRYSFGSDIQKRAKCLLEGLLDYAEEALKFGNGFKKEEIEVTPLHSGQNGAGLKFKVKRDLLARLSGIKTENLNKQEAKNLYDKVRNVVTCLDKFKIISYHSVQKTGWWELILPHADKKKLIKMLPASVGGEEAIAKLHRQSVESKADSGESFISFATSILEQIGFNQKFKMNRTPQYTGYRLKNFGETAKSYLLVLTQCKEGLYISISRDILNPYVLELTFYDDVWVKNEYGYNEAECQKFNHLYWVIPSREDIFFEISQDYKDIFTGESTGSFYLDPTGIDPDDLIHKDLKGFKLKRSEAPGFDWHFDHGDLLARLDQSDCCISMNNIDRLFPHTRQVNINSREILEEFIHYFGEIFIENY